MSQGLNVSILGGGSAYTPGLIQGFINKSEDVPLDRLVLMDIDAHKLESVGSVAVTCLRTPYPNANWNLQQTGTKP